MNYAKLRKQFKEILNRNDCSDEQADTFIEMGIRRISRVLRTTFQIDYKDIPDLTDVPLPDDLVAISEVTMRNTYINRVTRANKDQEEGYFLSQNQIHFTEGLKARNSSFRIIYYKALPVTTDGEESNIATSDLMDIVIYAALVFAADTFVDERQGKFERTMGSLADEIQTASNIKEMSGGLVIGSYGAGVA